MRRAALVGAAVLLAACGSAEPEAGEGIPASLEVSADQPAALTAVAAERVQGRTGPGGTLFEVALRTAGGAAHLDRRIGTRTFPLGLRTGERALTQYPCASCHQGRTVTVRRDPDVHQNVRPVHPAEFGARCATCHVADAVDRLALASGESVTLDHAYRLCGQCHFTETDAWAAGGHGKRLDGWRGRRVVMGCADCHDPHDPAPRPRVPFPGPHLPTSGAAHP